MKWDCSEKREVNYHPVEEFIPGLIRCLSCRKRWYHVFIFNWDG